MAEDEDEDDVLRAMLMRCGLTADAAEYATLDTGLGLDTLDAWRIYGDDDLDDVSRVLRKPGGSVGNGHRERTHPGFAVSLKALGNLRTLRAGLKYFHQVGRIVLEEDIDAEWLEKWSFLYDHYKKVARIPSGDDIGETPKIDTKDWAKTMETAAEYLRTLYGHAGAPLAYVIRKEEVPEDEEDDPQENYKDDHVEELIVRTQHTGREWKHDNRLVASILIKMFKHTPAYTHIFRKTANGREAWQKLQDVYLGPQNTQSQASKYERRIQNTHYSGETARFNFDTLVQIHEEAHARLEALEEHGYKGLDEGTKIRHLLESITCLKLKTAKEVVMSNKEYNTFEKAVRRLRDSVEPLEASRPGRSRQIAAVDRQTAEEFMPGIKADMSVDDRYYPDPEWDKLSKAKKKGVILKRQAREGGRDTKGRGRSGSKGDGGGGGAKKHYSQKQIAAIVKQSVKQALKKKTSKRKIAAVEFSDSSDSSDSSNDDEPPSKKKKKSKSSNRNHPGLKKRHG